MSVNVSSCECSYFVHFTPNTGVAQVSVANSHLGGGGCSQHAIENEGKDYCVFGFDEDAKTASIIDRFKLVMA